MVWSKCANFVFFRKTKEQFYSSFWKCSTLIADSGTMPGPSTEIQEPNSLLPEKLTNIHENSREPIHCSENLRSNMVSPLKISLNRHYARYRGARGCLRARDHEREFTSLSVRYLFSPHHWHLPTDYSDTDLKTGRRLQTCVPIKNIISQYT